jgi:flavin-dependent dehydrogenase
MTPFEVIVIGAGPSGSVAALEMSRMGARVALVDGSHPREKACGGGVTGRALELLANSPGFAGFGGRSIRTVRFEAGRKSSLVELPQGYLDVFSRETFDAALVDGAQAAGAVLIRDRALAFTRTDGTWTASVGGKTLTAPWLIGADGAAGAVRKKVTRPFTRGQLSIAAGSYVDGSDISEIVI